MTRFFFFFPTNKLQGKKRVKEVLDIKRGIRDISTNNTYTLFVPWFKQTGKQRNNKKFDSYDKTGKLNRLDIKELLLNWFSMGK